MRALLDTNVLVRHLTGDPPAQAIRATALLRGSHELIVTDVVFAEFVYVLESFYRRSRSYIAEAARGLLGLPSIAVVDHDHLFRAIELYELSPLHLADAYLAALAELSNVKTIASFDRRIDKVRTVRRVEP